MAAGLTHWDCQQVFHCFWGTAMVYVFAQLLGSVASAALVLPLYGFGQFGSLFDMRIFGFLGLSVPPHLRAQACRAKTVLFPDIRSPSHSELAMHITERSHVLARCCSYLQMQLAAARMDRCVHAPPALAPVGA